MAALLPPPPPPEPPVLGDGSIRSRLRPRTRGSVASSGNGSASIVERLLEDPYAQAEEMAAPVWPHPQPPRRRGKGKGRAKAPRGPVIEAEHEWVCPVGGCGRMHTSVRIAGEWRHDEKRGGIALFV